MKREDREKQFMDTMTSRYAEATAEEREQLFRIVSLSLMWRLNANNMEFYAKCVKEGVRPE
jgi:hypothetical protein